MRNASGDDTLAHDSRFMYSKLNFIHPTFLSRESNTFLERYYVSKDKFFVSVESRSEERSSGSELTHPLDVDEVAGGQFFRCFKVQMPNKDEGKEGKYKLTGGILSGNGSDLDMTFKKKSRYPWRYHERGPVRVFFHQQGTVVDPQTNPNYFDIHPGTEVRFSVKAKRTIRVSLPHGNCSNYNPYLRDKTLVYQQSNCMDLCYNDQLLRRKKIVSANYPMLESLDCWEGEAWNRSMHTMYAFAEDMKYVKHCGTMNRLKMRRTEQISYRCQLAGILRVSHSTQEVVRVISPATISNMSYRATQRTKNPKTLISWKSRK